MQSKRQKSEGSSDEEPDEGAKRGQSKDKGGSDDDKEPADSQEEVEGKGEAESAGGEEEGNKEKAAEGQQGVEEGGEGSEGKEGAGPADSDSNKVCCQLLSEGTLKKWCCASLVQDAIQYAQGCFAAHQDSPGAC